MLNKSAIHGILFDYGATIDSNGLHWAEALWQGYQAAGVPVGKEAFRLAYIYGERYLARNRVILPDYTFLQTLRAKIDIQLGWLLDEGGISAGLPIAQYAAAVADHCYAFAGDCIMRARRLIAALSEHYPLVLVSNFYGNINSVLREFELDGLFRSVVESSVVGVRKPDPAIFAIGVERLGLKPEETLVVGDSWTKDICPAAGIGCQTVWLRGRGWEPEPAEATADLVIDDFSELKILIENER
jgi:putative hydrolase of the HAD superfamily